AVTDDTNKPNQIPGVLARFVKIPKAKIPAIGTPNNPVISKNKFHVSSRFVETKYKAAPTPSKPAMTIDRRANITSPRPSPFPKKRCLKSVTKQAEILFKLDEIVD